jgi:hypothetical protein
MTMAWMGLRSAKKDAAEETEEERQAREEKEKNKKRMAGGYVRGGREARQQAMDEADE